MTTPWISAFEQLSSLAPPSAPLQPNPTFGTPQQDALLWDGQQSYADTCAIRCQEFILEQFTGRDIPEDALVQQAMVNGWYAPGQGTSPQDVGKLLEANGIPVNHYENANIFHLTNELAQGHKVIVGVDSGELWGGNPILESLQDTLGLSGADHAVVVSGIDTTDPNQVRVIISDPGTGQVAASYPLEQFVDAWRDSHCFMVATQEPAPSYLPEMVNFDYGLGHLETVWDLPYHQFLTLAEQPEVWDTTLDQALAEAAEQEMLEPVWDEVGDALAGEDSFDSDDHSLVGDDDLPLVDDDPLMT